MVLAAGPVCAQTDDRDVKRENIEAAGPMIFDIPAQPLEMALERYGSITGRDAIYKSSLMTDRRSMAVEGQFSPDAALTKLLEGTGLSAAYASPKSFVLLPVSVPATTVPSATLSQFYGQIQISLRKTLCADREARPGGYRIAVRLWLDAIGDVTQYERMSSTGSSRLDESIDQAMRHLQIGMQPPLGLGQPVSIVIKPQAPGVTMTCDELEILHAETAP